MKIGFFEDIFESTPSKRKHAFSDKVSYVGSETPLKKKSLIPSIGYSKKRNRALFLGYLVLFVFLVFVAKAFSLQLIKGEEYLALSEGNRIRLVSVPAERGLIYDRNGEILVRNKPSFIVELNTSFCSTNQSANASLIKCSEVIKQVSSFVDIEVEEKILELASNRLTLVLASDISKEELLPLEANISRFPSVSISTIPQRDYVYGKASAHVLGYVGFGDTKFPTIEGKMGLEESYEDYLSGVSGSRIIQADSSGKAVTVLSEKKVVSGKEISLHLDARLQQKAYEVLAAAVEGGDATGGAIIAQDPKTGGVLAMASYPTFDPNELSTGISSKRFAELLADERAPFFNRTMSAVYPPASTFKMVVASAALEEGVVNEHSSIFDPGYIQIGSYVFKNWNTSGHGDVNMRRALQVSNDTYFYTVGGGYGNISGVGIEKLAEWANKFGYGHKLGIDLSGEVAGNMPDGSSRAWYLGDTFITSIGQGDVLATPLQVNAMTMYFSNGGKIYKPTVVKATDGIETKPDGVFAENLVSMKNYEIIREGILAASQPGGTGYPMFDFADKHNGIRVAGKTGTAEFGSPDNEDTHAWFTVFGPYDEEASIVLTVFLESGGSGSDDAAPLARELFDLWFSNFSTLSDPMPLPEPDNSAVRTAE